MVLRTSLTQPEAQRRSRGSAAREFFGPCCVPGNHTVDYVGEEPEHHPQTPLATQNLRRARRRR